jgi:hypothetical protein
LTRGIQTAFGAFPTATVALRGVAFVLLSVLAIVVIGGNTPEGDPSAAKVTSFYQQHHTREIAAAFVLAAAVPFVVSFIPYADFFALVLSGVWIIAMSIMLFRMDRERRFTSAPQAA